MLIPSLYYIREMKLHGEADRIQFPRGESVILRENEWIDPELTEPFVALRMHVPWLIAIEAVKE